MRTLRRLTLLVSILVTGSLALAASADASRPVTFQGPGGGFLAAGTHDFTTARAMFNVYPTDPTQPQINLFVTRVKSISSPSGSPTATSDVTTLNLFVSTDFNSGGPNGNACALLDKPADFTLNARLQTASLHTTITETTPTCGETSLLLPFTLDVTWTGSGPIQTMDGTEHFTCSGYTDESKSIDTSNAARGTFTISSLSGSIAADQQTIGINHQVVHAHGAIPPDSCHGGVGKGGGRPTPAAGSYRVTLQEADTNFFSDDGQTQLFLTVTRTATTSKPLGGPATSTNETDLSFFLFSPTVNVSGCFVLANPDFTISSNLSMAKLHTTLTANTPGCGGATYDISPDPFTIDASWTGTAPIATTRDENHFACLKYHYETDNIQKVNTVATTTATLTGIDGPITSSGGLGSSDTRTHAAGVANPGCSFRG